MNNYEAKQEAHRDRLEARAAKLRSRSRGPGAQDGRRLAAPAEQRQLNNEARYAAEYALKKIAE